MINRYKAEETKSKILLQINLICRIFVVNRLMDLQTRKLNIIEYLTGLKDENIFRLIEDMINKPRTDKKQSYRPFTQQELLERAKKSNEDYLAGNFKDQEQLEIQSKQ